MAVSNCLFNIFTATLRIGGCSSIHNLSMCHAVVTGTHLSRMLPHCKKVKRKNYVNVTPFQIITTYWCWQYLLLYTYHNSLTLNLQYSLQRKNKLKILNLHTYHTVGGHTGTPGVQRVRLLVLLTLATGQKVFHHHAQQSFQLKFQYIQKFSQRQQFILILFSNICC